MGGWVVGWRLKEWGWGIRMGWGGMRKKEVQGVAVEDPDGGGGWERRLREWGRMGKKEVERWG